MITLDSSGQEKMVLILFPHINCTYQSMAKIFILCFIN